MVYYVPFIMSRITFAWPGNIMVQTVSPAASSAFRCLLRLNVVQLRKAGDRGEGLEEPALQSHSENCLYCRHCKVCTQP